MSRFGPTRAELRFRLVFSLAGLALLIAAYASRGISGIASLEIAIFGSAFFGGSALWCIWQLRKKDPPA